MGRSAGPCSFPYVYLFDLPIRAPAAARVPSRPASSAIPAPDLERRVERLPSAAGRIASRAVRAGHPCPRGRGCRSTFGAPCRASRGRVASTPPLAGGAAAGVALASASPAERCCGRLVQGALAIGGLRTEIDPRRRLGEATLRRTVRPRASLAAEPAHPLALPAVPDPRSDGRLLQATPLALSVCPASVSPLTLDLFRVPRPPPPLEPPASAPRWRVVTPATELEAPCRRSMWKRGTVPVPSGICLVRAGESCGDREPRETFRRRAPSRPLGPVDSTQFSLPAPCCPPLRRRFQRASHLAPP